MKFKQISGSEIESITDDKVIGFYSFTSKGFFPTHGNHIQFDSHDKFFKSIDELKKEINDIHGKWVLLVLYDNQKIYVSVMINEHDTKFEKMRSSGFNDFRNGNRYAVRK